MSSCTEKKAEASSSSSVDNGYPHAQSPRDVWSEYTDNRLPLIISSDLVVRAESSHHSHCLSFGPICTNDSLWCDSAKVANVDVISDNIAANTLFSTYSTVVWYAGSLMSISNPSRVANGGDVMMFATLTVLHVVPMSGLTNRGTWMLTEGVVMEFTHACAPCGRIRCRRMSSE